jgi:hypothetical protein
MGSRADFTYFGKWVEGGDGNGGATVALLNMCPGGVPGMHDFLQGLGFLFDQHI